MHVVFWDATLCNLVSAHNDLQEFVVSIFRVNSDNGGSMLFQTLMSAYKTTQCDNSVRPQYKASNNL